MDVGGCGHIDAYGVCRCKNWHNEGMLCIGNGDNCKAWIGPFKQAKRQVVDIFILQDGGHDSFMDVDNQAVFDESGILYIKKGDSEYYISVSNTYRVEIRKRMM